MTKELSAKLSKAGENIEKTFQDEGFVAKSRNENFYQTHRENQQESKRLEREPTEKI